MSGGFRSIACVGLVVGCNNTAEPVTPEPQVTATSSEPTATATAATGPSLCDEISAALEAAASGYAGYASKDKPVKSEDGLDGFQATRVLPGASACTVYGDADPSYSCDLGPAGTPEESGAILKAWETKLDGCPVLAAPFKKMTLGEHGKAWSDQKTKGERTVSLAFSGDDTKPRPVLVVRRFK